MCYSLSSAISQGLAGPYEIKGEMVESTGSTRDIKFQLRKDFELVKVKLPDLLHEVLKSPEFGVELDFGLAFRLDMETARCKRKESEIQFGTDNKKLKSLKVSRKTLVHEAIHAAGVNHDGKMRSLNFYSQLSRDLFTDKIMEKLGWEPPTEKETRKCSRRRRTLDYKYVAYCPECGNSWYRKKKSKLIKAMEREERRRDGTGEGRGERGEGKAENGAKNPNRRSIAS